MTMKTLLALVLGTGLLGAGASAQTPMTGDMTGHDHAAMTHSGHHEKPGKMHHGHAPGPIGVMGRHIMPKGKFMLAYRFGHMEMQGSRIGTTDVSPTFIATTMPNRFFGLPGQPPTLRVVPTRMDMSMHMLGAMYGATDRLTLSAMLPYVSKSMTALTFAGPAGATVLGANEMASEGLGDIRIGALYEAARHGQGSLTLGLGISLPTGSITETGLMLTPMGTRPLRRMAYGMQLGSGTVDLHPMVTWQSARGRLNWGTQASGIIRLGTNSEGYSLGHEAAVTAWTGYKAAPWLSLTGRIEARTVGHIDGQDPFIAGPMQGTDPLNYGGETVTVFAGADVALMHGPLKGNRLGLELGLPVYQDLNGVQLKRDWSLLFAVRRAF